jgi:hypothetical protein
MVKGPINIISGYRFSCKNIAYTEDMKIFKIKRPHAEP